MNSFPKSARLLSRFQYQLLSKQGMQLIGRFVIIEKLQGSPSTSEAKLGITVSRKFGKAHVRNRFKRIVREAFRHLKINLPPDLLINVKPRSMGKDASFENIFVELSQLLNVKI